MSNMSENKIDLEDLEGTVAEATGSKAVGRFTRVAFEAAMNLRAGLSREQTGNAMQSYQRAGRLTLTTLRVCFPALMKWKSSRRYRLSAKKD